MRYRLQHIFYMCLKSLQKADKRFMSVSFSFFLAILGLSRWLFLSTNTLIDQRLKHDFLMARFQRY